MIPLIVDLETEWRGGQNQALLLLKGLYERGHAAELLAAEGSALGARAREAGICVHTVSRGMARLPAARKIRDLMRDGRIDLVHANESHALTAAWLAGTHKKAPLLFSRRVGYPLGKNLLAKARFRAVSRIVANSNWVAEQAAASGADRNKLTVVYEGVEVPPALSETERKARRAVWKIAENEHLVGCVGVLSWDKGHEFVIRAMVDVRKKFPRCKLLLAGNGPSRGELQAFAERLGVGDAVIFAGFVKEISNVYRALDVFVFPSLFEGLGTSLLAAMANGVPSVTFFGCALGEIVENGVTGIQVEAKNSNQIAEAVSNVLTDREWAKKLGEAGRQSIAARFSAEKMVEETLKVYREVPGEANKG
ncbi:MAG TPA: glycosyltransferase family 4 protein [Candidatus Acidoferrum sp.]|nr:glycosyltransferase family 4 protein [Candidatus Acidoferrum sp.]